jgi:DNA-binding transcriptional regulator YiaG
MRREIQILDLTPIKDLVKLAFVGINGPNTRRPKGSVRLVVSRPLFLRHCNQETEMSTESRSHKKNRASFLFLRLGLVPSRFGPTWKPLAFFVDKKGCWIQDSHAANKDGYCMMTTDRGREGAHRAVCREVHGEPLLDTPVTRHFVCGDPRCVNPDHICWGTHLENSGDMLRHGTRLTGEKNGSAKLTAGDIEYIRGNPNILLSAIAKRLGVSVSVVSMVRSGKRWGSPTYPVQNGRRSGDGHPQKKLTDSDIREIRNDSESTQRELAGKKGVSQQLISKIKSGKRRLLS